MTNQRGAVSVAEPGYEAALEPVSRLTRDLRHAAASLGREEVRYLVDLYYALQAARIGTGHQTRTLTESGEPHAVIAWSHEQMERLEGQVRGALLAWAEADPVSQWAMSIVGIGPVLASGLRAHIEIEKAPTVGHIWRFAGLDPTDRWQKGEKRPWNASLKVLCWKIGESFVKVQNRPNDVYGKVFAERKAKEEEANARGDRAEQAREALATKHFRAGTDAYKAYTAGRLPQARVHARARRYAVKLFLAHWHHVAYETRYGELPPRPYVIERLGHATYLGPPNWPMKP